MSSRAPRDATPEAGSTESVLVARSLCKVFHPHRSPGGRLRDALFARSPDAARDQGFWALRNVSFELRRGETLGVMGRNGCGKTTLLEIIAGTLNPTSGEAIVRGELAALLELGAGFSPALTGRENVFVYGSLLGMSRAELRDRFDEIVEFAELRDVIDEPVRNYSSGMFVRLAFATAISSTPEILVIDEALAVGDEAFQRRCYARIEEMKRSGVSMLFVSHAAGTIMELCDRVLLLDRGQPLMLGSPRDAIRHYHRMIYAAPERQESIRREILDVAAAASEANEPSGAAEPVAGGERNVGDNASTALDFEPAPALEEEAFDPDLVSKSRLEYAPHGARIEAPSIQNAAGNAMNILRRGQTYFICYSIEFEADAHAVRPGMLIKNVVGTELGGLVASPRGGGIERVRAGARIDVRLPFTVRLAPDTYFANVGVVGLVGSEETHLHRIADALAFRVVREEESRVTGSVDFSTPESAQLEIRPIGSAGSE